LGFSADKDVAVRAAASGARILFITERGAFLSPEVKEATLGMGDFKRAGKIESVLAKVD